MKKILAAMMLVSSFAHAGWVKSEVTYEINTSVPSQIANALLRFPMTLDILNAENLVASSKVIVKDFRAETVLYRWVNDSSCVVPDPEKVVPAELHYYLAKYVFADQLDKYMIIEGGTAVTSPCHGSVKTSSVQKK